MNISSAFSRTTNTISNESEPPKKTTSLQQHGSTPIAVLEPNEKILPHNDTPNVDFIGSLGDSDTASISEHTITKATSTSKSAPADATHEIKITAQDLLECIKAIDKNLALFFVETNKENASKIFVLSEQGDKIELHENTIDSSITIEASHEEAKSLFVNQLMVFYGKAVIDCLYPEEARKEPLTLNQAHLLRQQLNSFQNSVEVACQGDPSKYEACLKSHLETLNQLQKSVTTTFESDGKLQPEVTSLTNYLSKQLGVSPETVQACVLAGLAVASVVGVASGMTLPVALHAAATTAITALSHSAGTGAVATSVTGALPTAITHATLSSIGPLSSIDRAVAGVAAATVAGGALGSAFGALSGAFLHASGGTSDDTTLLESIRAGAIGGTFAGLEIGFVGALLGPAALGVGIAHPATWGLYGSAIGAPIEAAQFGYLTYTESPEDAAHPSSFNTVIGRYASHLAEALNASSPLLGRTLQQLAETRGGRAAIAAAAGGIFGATALGTQAYLAGGLASLTAHMAAAVAAAV